jgi:hypothetical protein
MEQSAARETKPRKDNGKRSRHRILFFVLPTVVVLFLLFILGINHTIKSQRLLNAQNEKLEQATLIVSFDSYKWFTYDGRLSCDNPAQGLVVYFQNKSTAPVMIENSEISFFFGEESIISEPPKFPKNADDLSEKLLAPGERDSVYRTTPKFIPYYLNLHGMSSDPHR